MNSLQSFVEDTQIEAAVLAEVSGMILSEDRDVRIEPANEVYAKLSRTDMDFSCQAHRNRCLMVATWKRRHDSRAYDTHWIGTVMEQY